MIFSQSNVFLFVSYHSCLCPFFHIVMWIHMLMHITDSVYSVYHFLMDFFTPFNIPRDVIRGHASPGAFSISNSTFPMSHIDFVGFYVNRDNLSYTHVLRSCHFYSFCHLGSTLTDFSWIDVRCICLWIKVLCTNSNSYSPECPPQSLVVQLMGYIISRPSIFDLFIEMIHYAFSHRPQHVSPLSHTVIYCRFAASTNRLPSGLYRMLVDLICGISKINIDIHHSLILLIGFLLVTDFFYHINFSYCHFRVVFWLIIVSHICRLSCLSFFVFRPTLCVVFSWDFVECCFFLCVFFFLTPTFLWIDWLCV